MTTQDADFQVTSLVSVSTNKLLRLFLTNFLCIQIHFPPTPKCSAEIHLFYIFYISQKKSFRAADIFFSSLWTRKSCLL